MDKHGAPQRWFSGWRAHTPAPDSDAADLGTAFGLDLSLSELPHEPPTPAPTARRAGWMSRFTAARHKPA